MIFNFNSKSIGFGSPETSMKFEVDQIDDILMYFERFLKGCGYDIDGQIKIVKGEGQNYTFTFEGLEVKENYDRW